MRALGVNGGVWGFFPYPLPPPILDKASETKEIGWDLRFWAGAVGPRRGGSAGVCFVRLVTVCAVARSSVGELDAVVELGDFGMVPVFDGDGSAVPFRVGGRGETDCGLGHEVQRGFEGGCFGGGEHFAGAVAEDDLRGRSVDGAEAMDGDLHGVAFDLDVAGIDAQVGAGPVGDAFGRPA